jgi:hypothetical protein
MPINSNYSSFIAGFNANTFYLAADGGQFNGSEFGAAVLAYPSAAWLNDTSAAAPAEEQWWGNFDTDNDNGWSIGIAPVGVAPTQLALVGKIGTGAATITLSYVLSAADRAAFVERMMHVQLWLRNGVGYLVVNGAIVARAAVAAYGASANAPTLGAGVGGARRALLTQLGGASYFAGDLAAAVAASAAAAWQAACASFRNAYLASRFGSADWPHRYDINESMLGGATGTITRSAAGVTSSVPAKPPTTLADIGNEGPVVLDAGATSVALALQGDLADLVVFQYENPQWFAGGGVPFGVDPGGDDLSFLGIDVITETDAVWPIPDDTTFIEYEIVGGGGAGGGVAGDADESAGAGGGGAGAHTVGTLAVVPGNTLALTIGAGGVPGAAGAVNGGAGGDSSIGAITAPGGAGGTGDASDGASQAAAGGLGGVAGVGGSYMRPGSPGGAGFGVGAGLLAVSGGGGASVISGGAVANALNAASGALAGEAAVANSGAGGAGGAATGDGDVAGGAGGSGVIILRRYG